MKELFFSDIVYGPQKEKKEKSGDTEGISCIELARPEWLEEEGEVGDGALDKVEDAEFYSSTVGDDVQTVRGMQSF